MKTLLETLEGELSTHSRTVKDIVYVMSTSLNVELNRNQFLEEAARTPVSGDEREVAQDLVVVGDGFYLDRVFDENWGHCFWDFHEAPRRPIAQYDRTTLCLAGGGKEFNPPTLSELNQEVVDSSLVELLSNMGWKVKYDRAGICTVLNPDWEDGKWTRLSDVRKLQST